MKMTTSWIFLLAVLLSAGMWVGCGPGTTDGDDHADEHADHDDEHGDHPEHGPNGGHIVEFDCEGYHAEWVDIETTDDGRERILVIVLDEGNAEQRIPASSKMMLETKPKEGDAKTFEFRAVNAEGEPAMASQFEADQSELALNVGLAAEGGTMTLTVEIDGKPCKAMLERHEH